MRIDGGRADARKAKPTAGLLLVECDNVPVNRHDLARNAEQGEQRSEAVRRERLRQDAARPMHVNLAEGIALSHKLLSFAGAATTAPAKH